MHHANNTIWTPLLGIYYRLYDILFIFICIEMRVPSWIPDTMTDTFPLTIYIYINIDIYGYLQGKCIWNDRNSTPKSNTCINDISDNMNATITLNLIAEPCQVSNEILRAAVIDDQLSVRCIYQGIRAVLCCSQLITTSMGVYILH